MNARTFSPLVLLAVAAAAHADFASLALNGNAAVTPAGALHLTDAVNWQGGSAWTSTKRSVASGFDTSFDYHICEGNNADGITFAIQDHGTTDLGGLGGSLGFNGITDVFGVQLRTYDHNKIQIGAHTDLPVASVDNTGLRGDHHVRVTYVPGLMSVYLDGALSLSGAVDLTAYDPSGLAYVGFTAATGGSNDVQEIRNWSFASGSPQAVPEPTTVAALGLGALGLLKRRRSI